MFGGAYGSRTRLCTFAEYRLTHRPTRHCAVFSAKPFLDHRVYTLSPTAGRGWTHVGVEPTLLDCKTSVLPLTLMAQYILQYNVECAILALQVEAWGVEPHLTACKTVVQPLTLCPQEVLMIITRNCNECQEEYFADEKYLRRGQGLFCSQKCSAKNNGARRKISHNPNVSCALCSIEFYITPSKMKNSKSGLYFCCRAHKDQAQRLGGISEIMPTHYGTAVIPNYRKKAFRELPNRCRVCGYDEYPDILEVNHIDIDRSNNDISNLEILCPTHHSEFHYKTKTGKWRVKVA